MLSILHKTDNLVSPLALYFVGHSRRDLGCQLTGPSGAGAETPPQAYRKAHELNQCIKEHAPRLENTLVPEGLTYIRGKSTGDIGDLLDYFDCTMLESRAATGERMLKINDDLTLTLQKSKVFAGDFLFSTTDENEPIDYYIKAEDAERDIYHDSTHMASVRVTDDDGVEVGTRPRLGCQHDGDGANSWVKGHIGSADCPWDDGYLMSYKMQDERQYKFSPCCQREIRNLYKMLESRAATGERMLKINDDLTLTLQKSKVFADDFLFSTTENNEPIDYYVRAEDAERDIYHDPAHMASVKVTDEDGVEV
ncbi:hypothetical protein HPB47_007120, partial [Ixodes persulcatus]